MKIPPTLIAYISRSLLPLHAVEVAGGSSPTLALLLVASRALVVTIDIAIMVGVHVISCVGDTVACIGVVRKAPAPRNGLAGIGVPRYSVCAAVDHAGGWIVAGAACP